MGASHFNGDKMYNRPQFLVDATSQYIRGGVDGPHAIQSHVVQESQRAANAVLAVTEHGRAASHDLGRIEPTPGQRFNLRPQSMWWVGENRGIQCDDPRNLQIHLTQDC